MPDQAGSASAPTITTDRLILRAYKRADFEPFCATRGKSEVMQYISAQPLTRSQLWEKFLRGPGFWALLGYGSWTIERRSDGRVLGEVGFGDFKRDLDPPMPDMPEGAWLFDSDVHGQGYASEALSAALGWADEYLASALCCIISPANAPSLRLAERHGFVRTGMREHSGAQVVLLERPAPACS